MINTDKNTPSASLPRLPRWLLFSWGVAIVFSGLLSTVTDEYRISNARLEFLTELPGSWAGSNYTVGSRSMLLTTLDGFYSAPMADGRLMIVDGSSLYMFDPATRKFYQPSGVDINLEANEDDTAGSIEGRPGSLNNWYGKYTHLMLNDKTMVRIGGAMLQTVAEGGARNYRLDTFLGVLPFAVKSGSNELIIMGGERKDLITTPSGRLDDPAGQSKIFKYNFSTQQLSDTGKLAPVRFGGDSYHRAIWRDLGDRVLIWERTGGLWVMNKRSLTFKSVGTDLQTFVSSATASQPRPQIIYQLYSVSKWDTLIAPSRITLNDPVYLYNSRWNRLTKFSFGQFADPATWVRAKQPASDRTTSEQDLRYFPAISSGRFVSLLPHWRSDANSGLDNFWDHRLVFDLATKTYLPIDNQPNRIVAERFKENQMTFLHSIPLSTDEGWLLESSAQDAVYRSGISLAPVNWLTWDELRYPLSFLCLSLLTGAGLLWWVYRRSLKR